MTRLLGRGEAVIHRASYETLEVRPERSSGRDVCLRPIGGARRALAEIAGYVLERVLQEQVWTPTALANSPALFPASGPR